MSYRQETQGSATRVEMVGRWSLILSSQTALPLLLLLAFLHGSLYALFLPPWGLIDEAQHLHYIQYIAEQQALPVAGELYLSDEIVESLFATARWQTFHWTPPPAPDPAVMGLEGYSYEAYQPPLFYLLMTPLYWMLPADMLVKVYGLRLAVLLLSLITVWAVYRSAQILRPQIPQLAFFAGLLLVAIPERAIATSRINNDVLLEVLAALFFVVLTQVAVAGFTPKRSLLLGALLGLAAWAKLSGALLGVPLVWLLWLRRHEVGGLQQLWKPIGWMALLAAPLGLSLAIRNLWLYQDLTGFSSFDRLHRLAAADGSLAGFAKTLVSVLNHFWLVWWKGSDVGQNCLLTGFYLLMAIALAAAWGRLFVDWWRKRNGRDKVEDSFAALMVVYLVAVLCYAVAVMNSYYQGMVPIIQGRFMLPALVPFVLLLTCGLWRFARAQQIILAVTVVLWGMGLLSLFGNLVPYFYYWSGDHQATNGLMQTLAMVYPRVLFDKPSFVGPLLLPLTLSYGCILLLTLIGTVQAIRFPQRWLPSFAAVRSVPDDRHADLLEP